MEKIIVTIPALGFGPASDILCMTREQAAEMDKLLQRGAAIYVELESSTVMRLSPFQLNFTLFDTPESVAYEGTPVVDVRGSLDPAPPLVVQHATVMGNHTDHTAPDYEYLVPELADDPGQLYLTPEEEKVEQEWWDRILEQQAAG